MKDEDFVNIDYVGRIKESGEIFDLTDAELAKESNIFNPQMKYGSVTVIIGAGHILKGLENKIKELKAGDRSEFEIKPEDAFGARDARLVKMFNANMFKKQGITPIPGRFVDFGQTKGRVMSVAGGRVRVDFNHPLAGKTLSYNVIVNKKVTDASEQINAIVAYYTAIDKDLGVAISGDGVKITLPSGSDVSSEVKEKISLQVTKYVKGVEKVEFAEVFAKKG